jgi:HTH-type transcriptional regulator, competence development regulator
MPKPARKSAASSTLGLYLQELRKKGGFTLREVDEATEVSNAYLSQLETGKITKPSPHILHTLAGFYRVPYESLMERAGYFTTRTESDSERRSGRLPASALADVTKDEELELLQYLNFLRSKAEKNHGKS